MLFNDSLRSRHPLSLASVHSVESSVFDSDKFQVLNAGEINVVSLEVYRYSWAAHEVFHMWINRCIPGVLIEARWIECVRRASVCCVRIIRDLHRSKVGATHQSSGTIVTGCPSVQEGGAELQPLTRRVNSRAIALATASC